MITPATQKEGTITRNALCRVCQSADLVKVLSLGPQPLANRFLTEAQLAEDEPFYPLDVYFCNACNLLQLRDVVSPEALFHDYVYASSTSASFVAHFQSFAGHVSSRFGLGPESLVVDVGSNDGVLLKPFRELGCRVLGIEPAVNIGKLAIDQGIETWTEFFNLELARKIVSQRGPARLITATNVFAHVNDLDQFLEAVKKLLGPDGVFIIEVPYLYDFLKDCLFDTVYHEHLSYYSIKPLQQLFQRMGLAIFDVQKVSTHGGSIRVFVQRDGGKHPQEASLEELVRMEQEAGLYQLATFREFAQRIQQNKSELWDILVGLKSQGKRIAGYGAPAKGNTLINYFRLGPETLDYIVDDSPLKQGLYTPGAHIPVVSPTRLNVDKPQYVLVLAWNFAGPITEKLSHFRAEGGKFIIPVPRPQVVG